MRAAGHHGYFERAKLPQKQPPRMTYRGRNWPSRYLGITDFDTILQFTRENAEAAAEHHSDGGAKVGPAFDQLGRFLNHTSVRFYSSIPAMHADMKFARDPAATARNPSRARSDLRFGASAPMPPI